MGGTIWQLKRIISNSCKIDFNPLMAEIGMIKGCKDFNKA